MRKSLIIFILGCSIGQGASSVMMADSALNVSTPKAGVCMKNLAKNIDHNPKTQFQDQINKMGQSDSSAYAESMLVLASSMLGDPQLYATHRDSLLEALGVEQSTLEKNTLDQDDIDNEKAALLKSEAQSTSTLPANFHAWLLGRALVAAHNMEDTQLAANLATVLEAVLTDTKVEKNAMYAWSFGYLNSYYAQVDMTKYNQHKHTMMDATAEMAKIPNTETDALTNKLWARVMTAYAAANANDKANFDETVVGAKDDTSSSTPSMAFNRIPKEDYRAWALSIMAQSAVLMNDKDLYQKFGVQAKLETKRAKDINNKTLAGLTTVLAGKCATEKFYVSESMPQSSVASITNNN